LKAGRFFCVNRLIGRCCDENAVSQEIPLSQFGLENTGKHHYIARMKMCKQFIKPEIDPTVMNLLMDIHNHGGRPLFVGGWVRDFLRGKESKDLDIEVFNLPLKQLRILCRQHGQLITVGAAFAVLKLTLSTGQIVDISLPRRERQKGQGHRGFDIQADPFMSVNDAASRRDLTINAVSMDPLTGEILDPVHGLDDLNKKILRHIGPRFAEDPLRVLRVYRFQSVLDFDIALETRVICGEISKISALKTLPRERIEEELRKLILLGTKRSTLRALINMQDDGVLASLFPELNRLSNVPQDSRYHAEGNVLTHTFLTVVESADIARRDNLPLNIAWALCLSALIHDLGKSDTTKQRPNGTITSYGHDKAGLTQSADLLNRLTGHSKTRDIALSLAANHMRPLHLAKANRVTDNAIRRLAVALEPASIDLLARLVEADTAASIRGDGSESENAHLFLRERAKALGISRHPPKPLIRGRDLIVLAGKNVISEKYLTGGPHFSTILKQVYQAQLDGKVETKHDALLLAITFIKGRFDNTGNVV
jgi:tRNA nucleotidyltransferase (CCA-adding enzyme)